LGPARLRERHDQETSDGGELVSLHGVAYWFNAHIVTTGDFVRLTDSEGNRTWVKQEGTVTDFCDALS
jgi:hypothetical protein